MARGWWIGLLFWILPVWGETVRLYNYHQHPPFMTAPQQGLTWALADYLNKKLGEPLFEVWTVNRYRLQLEMDQPDFKGVVAWVNPAWFGDEGRRRYLWSLPMMRDTNELISSRDHPIDYRGPDSIKGLTFGGIIGYHFAAVDGLVASGQMKRSDAKLAKTNLDLLLRHRIDITMVPGSALNWFILRPEYHDKLYVSPFPLFSYTRHLLLSPNLETLHRRLIPIIDAMDTDPIWHQTMARFMPH